MAEAMIAEFSWDKASVYGALTFALAFSAIAAIPIGILIDKGFGRRVMSLGALFAGLLLMGWSQISSVYGLYFILSGIGLVQAATLYSASFAVIANLDMIKDKKKTIATLTLWGGFASTVFIPLIEVLNSSVGWRSSLQVLGAINFFVGIFIYSQIPIYRIKSVKKTKVSSKIGAKWAFTQPFFWALLIAFLLHASVTSAFKFHLYPMLQETEIEAKLVVTFLALMGPAQVLGRFVIMHISTSRNMSKILLITTLAFPMVFAGFWLIPMSKFVLPILIIIFGAAGGVMTIVKGVAIPEFLTTEAYGEINGAMSTPITIAKALSPSIAAMIWTMSGNYHSLFFILFLASLLVVLCFGVVSFLHRSRGREVQYQKI